MILGDLSITVKDRKKQKIYGQQSVVGEIKIGEFKELFVMSLVEWTLVDYENQWNEGIEKIRTHDQSCLITNVQLSKNPLIVWWVLYREENVIYVQNELITDERLQLLLQCGPFNRQTCYQFIEPRCIVTEDGDRISEWSFILKSSQ